MQQFQEQALAAFGFTRVSPTTYRMRWSTGSASYVMTICEYEKDWGFVWQRGMTYTIAEERAPSFDKIIEKIWTHIFRITEHSNELIRFQAQHVTHGTAIYGSVLRQLAREDFFDQQDEGRSLMGVAAIPHAIEMGGEQGQAVKVAMTQLGIERAAQIYDEEWDKLVARSHPKE